VLVIDRDLIGMPRTRARRHDDELGNESIRVPRPVTNLDLDVQRETLSRVRSLMNPGSYLVLGCAETTLNVDDCFERIEDLPRSGCYRLEKG
jgi:hypothetical protein